MSTKIFRSFSSLFLLTLFIAVASNGSAEPAQADGGSRRAPRAIPSVDYGFPVNWNADSPQAAQGAVNTVVTGPKAVDEHYPARLAGETLPEYLARNPQLRGTSGRLPAGEFTVNYFGDISSVDINPGDGICADTIGECGLRAAIMEANALEDGSIIYIPAGSTINLAAPGINEDSALTGDLDIFRGMRIIGGGADNTVINAGSIDRVFDIWDGVVDIVDVTITGGNTSGYTEVTKTDGGGIWVNCGADVLLNRVTITGNQAAVGGGLQVGDLCPTSLNILYLYNSTIHDNVATLGIGGLEIYQNASVTISNSTISQNDAPAFGGGISVENDGANFPSVSINHTTIADNKVTAAGAGSGLSTFGDQPITLSNSIIAYNTANEIGSDCKGSYTSLGDNVYRVGTGCQVTASDVVNNSPGLGLLALNAPGTTPTNALSSSSVAVDLNEDECPDSDQRGVTRPQGAACDSGSYERHVGTELITNNSFESGATGWIVKNSTGDKVKCKPGFPHTGSCAFRFKGKPGEKSKIQQNINVTSIAFADGDSLLLNFWLNTPVTQPGKVKVVIGYSDLSKNKVVGTLEATSGYQLISGSTEITGSDVVKLKAMIAFKGTSGKLLVDDFSLLLIPGTVSLFQANPITLPDSSPLPLPSSLNTR